MRETLIQGHALQKLFSTLNAVELEKQRELIFKHISSTIDSNTISLQKLLNGGSSGDVYSSTYNGEDIAVKHMHSRTSIDSIFKEILVLRYA